MNIPLALSKQQTGLILSQKEEKALQSLEPAEQNFVALAKGKKLNELEPVKVIAELIKSISAALAIAGQRNTEDDIVLLFAEETFSRLMAKYPGMTIDEIKFAIKNGVYGEYGDFYGLNPKSFMQFVEGYRFDQTRVKAINKYLNAEAELEHEKHLTPEEKEQSRKSFCNTLFADFLTGKLNYKVIPRLIFKYLEAQELLLLTYDEKKAIEDRAYKQFTKELAEGERDQSLGGAIAGMFYSNDPKETIKTIASQFAVMEYFERMAKAKQTVIFEN